MNVFGNPWEQSRGEKTSIIIFRGETAESLHYFTCNGKLKSTLSSGKMFVNPYQLSKIILQWCNVSIQRECKWKQPVSFTYIRNLFDWRMKKDLVWLFDVQWKVQQTIKMDILQVSIKLKSSQKSLNSSLYKMLHLESANKLYVNIKGDWNLMQ